MRKSRKRHAANVVIKTNLKKLVKQVRELTEDVKPEDAAKALQAAVKALDKAAKRNVIHSGKADRMKSRLSKAVRKRIKK